jgi:hypothetical protein
MALYLVQNFASGLDLRRSAETAPPGSLRVLTNAFINEGGEIEKHTSRAPSGMERRSGPLIIFSVSGSQGAWILTTWHFAKSSSRETRVTPIEAAAAGVAKGS